MESVWNRFMRWGSHLLRQFRSATPVLSGLAVLLSLVGIWWLGPHWLWQGHMPLAELTMRFLASVLILLVPLLFWSLALRQRYRRLASENEHRAALAADPCLAYVQAQERALQHNLAVFLEHARGRRALYRLPWYLVLGATGVGKTSFIKHSRQKFALTKATGANREAQDEHLVYPVEWWMGDEALLIDPPGQFTELEQTSPDQSAISEPAGETEHALSRRLPENIDRRLWAHLLEWLTARRSRRVLNGVVVVVDIAQLSRSSLAQRRHLALQLRTRLYELTTQLGTRLPLYIVLSKADLLDGFEELFATLPVDARQEVMGFSFSLRAVEEFDAWLDEFSQHLDRFVAALGERVMDCIALASDGQTRDRLVSLLWTLAGMRPTLRLFFEEMLASDRFTAPALVRGVYLSSVLQHGQSHNPFVQSIARSHGLEAQPEESKPGNAHVTYFAQRLFQQAIYPEAGLAGDNIKVARSKRQTLLAGSGVAALMVFVAWGGWQHYFVANRDKATMVLARSQDFSARTVDVQEDSTGRNLLAPLGHIRNALSVYGDYRDAWPGVSNFGLYQGRAIGPMVDEAYLSLLSRRFLPAIASGVITRMSAAPQGSEEQLAALRVYRMIEDRDNRQPQLVKDWMARQWQIAYPGQGQLQENLMRHLDYALRYADADMPQYRERVADTQQQLRKMPLAQRVYMSLKQSAREHLHTDMDLRNEVGPAFDVVYGPGAREAGGYLPGFALPALLTAKGFQGYFEPRSDDFATLAMIDQWVLGERRQIDYSQADRQALAARLRTLYSADYVGSWRRVLNQLRITDFSDLGHAVEVLGDVIGPAAPIRRLLEAVSENSTLHPALALAAGPASALSDLSQQASYQQAVAIRREFSALAKLLEEKADKPAYYDQVLGAISAVYDYSKAIEDAPDRGTAALTAVLARFALVGPDPVSALQRIAAGLPEPINAQVGKLADQTARVLLIEALRELERRWDADVYSFYQQRLAGRYPFAASRNDASLEDFEALFGPKGRLQQFQDRYLNVFLKDNLDALRSATQDGYLVRRDALDQLSAAERIRETFFDNRGGLGVQFSLEPLGLSGNKRSSVLALDGQLIPYSHGPSSRVGLIWPNTLTPGPGSRLALVHAGGNTSSLGFQGPWSLFRLMSSGQLYGHTDTSVDLSFRVGDGIMRYRITAQKSFNPFTRRPFNGFTLPRTLLESSSATAVDQNVTSR